MVKPVTHSLFGQSGGICRHKAVFGLPLKLWIAQKHRQHDSTICQRVIGADIGRFLIACQFTKCPQGADNGLPKTGFVGAARWRRHSVAIAAEKPVFIRIQPGDGPFKFLFVKLGNLGKRGGNHQPLVVRCMMERISKATGKMQIGLGRNSVIAAKQCRITAPANFNTGK